MQETGNKILQQTARRADTAADAQDGVAPITLSTQKKPRLTIRVGLHTLSFYALDPGSAAGI